MIFQTAFIVLSLIPDRGMYRGRICRLHRFRRKRLDFFHLPVCAAALSFSTAAANFSSSALKVAVSVQMAGRARPLP